MNKALLQALRFPAFIGTESEPAINIKTLIRMKKLIAENAYDGDYDFNRDGVLDEQDVAICRKICLGVLNAEDYIS